MIKLFYSGVYASPHSQITKKNIKEKLHDDVRSHLVDNINDVLYYSKKGILTKNPNVLYMGGFYFEKPHKLIIQGIVDSELSEILHSNLIVVNLLGDNAIASISELLYAASKNKQIEVFVKNTPNPFTITSKYWFPILTATKLTKSINIHKVSSNQDVINFIMKLN